MDKAVSLMMTDYLIKECDADLERVLSAPEVDAHYSIYINYVSLSKTSKLAEELPLNPQTYLSLWDKAAVEAQRFKLANNDDAFNWSLKKNVHIRMKAINVRIEEGKAGELVDITGIIVRMSQPTVLRLSKKWLCKKCEHISVTKLELEYQKFPDLKQCEACQSKNINLIQNVDAEDCADYQEIKLQGIKKEDNNGSYSTGMQIILLHDLVDTCTPGEDVQISGYVIRRWVNLSEGKRAESVESMVANNIVVLRKVLNSDYTETELKQVFQNYWDGYESNPLEGRDRILAAICPQLFGMYTVKLALAVVLSGGVVKINKSNVRVRGESHLLMIGDPGTGKSQILRTSAKLGARSVITTGLGTSSAGLTAGAVRDSDGWHLEAGALVLADGGVCCIDEFTTMNTNDRASLHEAMEQQTVSVAKAGLISKLNCQCSVIAATNPPGGKFVEGVEMKSRIGSPLLSRFDIILILKDNKNILWDTLTTAHSLRTACAEDPIEKVKNEKPINILAAQGKWSNDSLREYFAHIHTINPVLSDDAQEVLSKVFLYHRQNPSRQDDRSTNRLLDSLIRLAEGHARLMYRNKVTIADAIVAAKLVGTLAGEENVGDPFPEDPSAAFTNNLEEILNLIGLSRLI